jgi:hypothetical protein
MTESANNTPAGDNTPPDNTPPDNAPKYTDTDLDKYKGSARKEGRQAAINELLGKAEGAQSVDDLIAAYQERKALEEASQTEAQRIQAELDKVQAERDQMRTLAEQRLVDSELREQLIAAGVPAGSVQLKDAMNVLDRSGIELGENGAVSGAEEVVTAALEQRPWLTGDTTPPVHHAVDTTQTTQGGPVTPDNAMAAFLGALTTR